MDKDKLACGVWPLIEDGIRRYMAEHGCKPVAVVLHPAQTKEVCEQSGSDPTLLDDVSIAINPQFELPVLVNEAGDYFGL